VTMLIQNTREKNDRSHNTNIVTCQFSNKIQNTRKKKHDSSTNTDIVTCQFSNKIQNTRRKKHNFFFGAWVFFFFSRVLYFVRELTCDNVCVMATVVFFSRVLYFVRELTCDNVCVMAGVVFFSLVFCLQNTREKPTPAIAQTLPHVSSLTKYRTREKKTTVM
jgi:hypothetical protein